MVNRQNSWKTVDPDVLRQILFSEASIGMFLSDAHGRLISVNPPFLGTMGYSEEELLTFNFNDLIFSENPQERPLPLDDLSQGRRETKEIVLIRKDGSLLLKVLKIRKINSHIYLGFLNETIDHRLVDTAETKRPLPSAEGRKAGADLRESEEKYRRLVETTATGYVILDDQGRVLDANGEYVRLTGRLHPEEVVGHSVLEWTAPYDLEYNAAEVRKCLEQGYVRNLEIDYLCPDGRVTPIEINATVLNAPEGLRILTLCRDISYRREMEEALRTSEANYRTLFQSNPQPMWVYDLQTLAFLAVNDAAIANYGYSLDEFLGMTIADIRPEEDVGRLRENVRQVGETPFDRTDIWRHRKKDGSIIEVEITSHHLNYLGRSARLVLSYDVTERRKIAEEKEKIQAQFLQSQKMESVARLAGGVAHDFNNMLGVILGQAELGLLEISPSDPLYHILQEIQKAAQRSAELTQQLLAYARKQTVAPMVLDLNTIVGRLIRMLQRLIGEDIDLAWKPSADLWGIKMDPSQIDQILVNLCVNARDAITGVGKITIETGNVSFDETYCTRHPGFISGTFVMLAVSDNGKGMNKDVLAHLFEPFYTTKEAGKGTGLGLATVYGIVKQNNGFINVYSEPGQGTTVKIYLPQSSGQGGSLPVDESPETPLGNGETILLVEDEASLRNMGQTMLERLGYGVLTAGTPGEALSLAKIHADRIQLLITDVVMPEMHGKELVHIMETIRPGLKCLFTSGYTSNVIAHHGVLDEGVHFLPKPFSLKELGVKVREALDESRPENF